MQILLDIEEYAYRKTLTPATLKAMLKELVINSVTVVRGGDGAAIQAIVCATYRSRYIRCPVCNIVVVKTAAGVPTRHRPCDQ